MEIFLCDLIGDKQWELLTKNKWEKLCDISDQNYLGMQLIHKEIW
jgi:hypothetical protein